MFSLRTPQYTTRLDADVANNFAIVRHHVEAFKLWPNKLIPCHNAPLVKGLKPYELAPYIIVVDAHSHSIVPGGLLV
jgi:hypothetical protein